MNRSFLAAALLVGMGSGVGTAGNADDTSPRTLPARKSLERIQWLVGRWKGVGQLRRGSRRGAWTETSEWAWNFEQEAPSLRVRTEQAKYLAGGEIRPGERGGEYDLLWWTPEDEQPVKYVGEMAEDGRLVFAESTASENSTRPARIVIRQTARGDRLVVRLERRTVGNRYERQAEIGYTRVGSDFGRGTTTVECVVTGGLGTIPVNHEGRTYYVCCGGCRDYFNEDPARVLAEYQRRKSEQVER